MSISNSRPISAHLQSFIRRGTAARATAMAVLLATGCATHQHSGDIGHESAAGGPSAQKLQRVANSAANGGNVNVRFVDGVAYVTGRVDSALEEGAISRSLRKIDGVERVETRLSRNM